MSETIPPYSYKPKTLPFTILGIVILLLSIVITVRWIGQVKPKKPQETEEELPFVSLQDVTLSDNQAIFSTGGFVRAKYSSNFTVGVNGQVIEISPNFVVGNKVKKGDILATIDNKNYIAALENAKADLATAKSHYSQELARARQAAQDAKRLGVKTSSLLLRQPQVAAAKAVVENAKAQLKLAKENLSDTVIRSPFDAIIQKRHIATGDRVTPATVIAQLVDIHTFTVRLNVTTSQFNLLEIGNTVALTNQTSGQHYSAKINRFDPSIDKITRTVGVYVDINNPLAEEQPLLLDTYLYADIIGKTFPNTMWIDNKSSVENSYVWVKDDTDSLKKVAFKLIHRDKNRSLVQFDGSIKQFIVAPQDSFFVGEKVTTKTTKTTKTIKNIDTQNNNEKSADTKGE